MLVRSRSQPSRLSLLLAATALVAIGASCGGGGSKANTYDVSAAPFSFQYPKTFSQIEANTGSEFSGRPPAWKFAIGIDGANVVVTEAYTLKRSSDSYKPAVFSDFVDAAAKQIAKNNGSHVTKESSGKLAGLGSHVYELSENDGGLASQLIFAFRGKNQYFVRCQWDAEGSKLVRPACDQVVRTLKLKTPKK